MSASLEAIPDISEPAAACASSEAAGPGTSTDEQDVQAGPPPAALGRYESECANEVNTIEDLHVVRSFDLGPEDVPKDLSDDESSLPDDSSSVASEAMEDAPPEPEPPAEDHSVQQLLSHTEPVFSVAVNAVHPELIATGGGDDVGYIWRFGQPQPIGKLQGHTDTISALGFSADGTLLASAGLDGAVRVWNVTTGELVVALDGPTQGINWLCWHARGSVLLAGSEDATAWMWKLPEGTVMQIFSAHSASVSYGGFVNNGKNVITASEDGTVRVWNPRTGTVDHCLHTTAQAQSLEPRPVTSLSGHATQPVFLFGMDDGGLKVSASTQSSNITGCSAPCHQSGRNDEQISQWESLRNRLNLSVSCGEPDHPCTERVLHANKDSDELARPKTRHSHTCTTQHVVPPVSLPVSLPVLFFYLLLSWRMPKLASFSRRCRGMTLRLSLSGFVTAWTYAPLQVWTANSACGT